jgi:hypothetical protein
LLETETASSSSLVETKDDRAEDTLFWSASTFLSDTSSLFSIEPILSLTCDMSSASVLSMPLNCENEFLLCLVSSGLTNVGLTVMLLGERSYNRPTPDSAVNFDLDYVRLSFSFLLNEFSSSMTFVHSLSRSLCMDSICAFSRFLDSS